MCGSELGWRHGVRQTCGSGSDGDKELEHFKWLLARMYGLGHRWLCSSLVYPSGCAQLPHVQSIFKQLSSDSLDKSSLGRYFLKMVGCLVAMEVAASQGFCWPKIKMRQAGSPQMIQ